MANLGKTDGIAERTKSPARQALNRISSDFRGIVANACPRCTGAGPTCIVESMEHVADTETARTTSDESMISH